MLININTAFISILQPFLIDKKKQAALPYAWNLLFPIVDNIIVLYKEKECDSLKDSANF